MVVAVKRVLRNEPNHKERTMTKTKTMTKARIAELQEAQDELMQELECVRTAIRGIPAGKAQDLLLHYAQEMCIAVPCDELVGKYRERLIGAVTMMHEQGFITRTAWSAIYDAVLDMSAAARYSINIRRNP